LQPNRVTNWLEIRPELSSLTHPLNVEVSHRLAAGPWPAVTVHPDAFTGAPGPVKSPEVA
jgi:hypothetical protein